MTSVRLDGRTCVVTGASSGIGEETALGLARLGARVLLVCRSRERGERSRERIRAATGSDAVELALADLASLAEIRRLADALLERCPQIQLLVNNAGVFSLRRTTTIDGFETTFAVNQLAYFLLTRLLLERIVASAPARIVNVASEAHRLGALDPDDLQSERGFRPMRVYGRSKSANILFTLELARRLEGTGVTANAVHPGAVATRLGHQNLPAPLRRAAALLLRPFMRSPARGAETSLYVATAPELAGVSGRYFADARQRAPAAAARDPELARRLWELCAELCDAALAASGARETG